MTVDPIRKILPYTSILVVIATLYVAYTFYSRKTEADRLEQQSVEKKAEQDRDSVARMGGASLKITNFYSNPGAISRGQSAQLCYGVVNAKSLTLAPPVEDVWPSLSRCFAVTPKATTNYVLTAHDDQGGSSTKMVTLTVQ